MRQIVSGLNTQRYPGLLEWLKRQCARRGMTLDEVFIGDGTLFSAAIRRELWSVAIWTWAMGWTEAARVFGVDHTALLAAVRKHEKQLEAEHAAH